MKKSWAALSSFFILLGIINAAAQVDIYSTGFEPPTFSPGQLNGQDQWRGTDFGLPVASPAVVVTTNNPPSGSQDLLFDGSKLPSADSGAAATHRTEWDTSANDETLVTVQAAMRFDGILETTTHVALEFKTIDSLGTTIAEWDLNSNGNAGALYTNAGGSFSVAGGTAFSFGQYNTFSIRMDYNARSIDFFFNGLFEGTGPMSPSITETLQISQFTFFVESPADPAAYKVYIDDFGATASLPVPEPSESWLLLLGVAVITCSYHRFRRSRKRQHNC